VDAFLLFNEIDLLEIRLTELGPVVDKFVIVEADRTFAGRPKPLFFPQWRERFRQWDAKIVYRPIRLPATDILNDEKARFRQEALQREQIGHAVAGLGLRRDDVVVVSDIDEIWRARCAPEILRAARDHDGCVLSLKNYRGYINNLSADALNGIEWIGPVACRMNVLARRGAEAVRRMRAAPRRRLWRRPIVCIEDAGWHLSSLGGPDAFWIKAQNFSHIVDPHRIIEVPPAEQEVRVVTGPLARAECIARQRAYLAHAKAPAFSPLSYQAFEIDQDVPEVIRTHKENYRRFFFFSDCV
jgi:beta-1,4-mannosyl-glycoprotein beta-1,4-N-acetylglucosaminyltransferase